MAPRAPPQLLPPCYQVDQFGNNSIGFKKYENPTIFRSTVEELFTKEFLSSYLQDLLINFTSSEGRAESYNMLHRGGVKEQFFEKFVKANSKTGGHFRRKRGENCEELLDTDDIEEVEGYEEDLHVSEGAVPQNSTMHLLGKKNLSFRGE